MRTRTSPSVESLERKKQLFWEGEIIMTQTLTSPHEPYLKNEREGRAAILGFFLLSSSGCE